jgi:hypothetical protein
MTECFIHRVILFPCANAGDALAAGDDSSGRKLAAEEVNQGSFADSGFSGNEDDAALALIVLTDAGELRAQQRKLPGAIYESGRYCVRG